MRYLILTLLLLVSCQTEQAVYYSQPKSVCDTISGDNHIWDVELYWHGRCCDLLCECGYCNLGSQWSMAVGRNKASIVFWNTIYILDISDYQNDIDSAFINLWCWYSDSADIVIKASPLLDTLYTKDENGQIDGTGNGITPPTADDYSPTGYCQSCYLGECIMEWRGVAASQDYDSNVLDATELPQCQYHWVKVKITNCVNHFIDRGYDKAWMLLYSDNEPYTRREFNSCEADSASFVQIWR